MTMQDDVQVDASDDGTGRRDAIKKGAAAAGVVAGAWVAPVVSGIGIAPAAAAGCSNPLPPPALPSSKNFQFNVSSNTGGWSDPAEWTSTSQTFNETFNNTCTNVTYASVTARAPGGGGNWNIDDPCFQPVSTVTAFTGWSNCYVTGFNVNSCPPFGIPAPNGCGRTGAGGCSAALNGSATGTVFLTCVA